MTDTPTLAVEVTRSGFVALVGRPNVGKSTLLNRVLESKVAIVSPKPQTTRTRIQGMLTRGDTQYILVDTPGWSKERGPLGKLLRRAAGEATEGADVTLLMVDAGKEAFGQDVISQELLSRIKRQKTPAIVAINKVDSVENKNSILPQMAALQKLHTWHAIIPISAHTGVGLDDLFTVLRTLMPEGPALFPPDVHTDQLERHLCTELVREQLLLRTHDEVPHSSVVVLDSFEDLRDAPKPQVRLEGRIYVERDSQKAIVIGRGGAQIRAISEAARHQIEAMLDSPVYLRLTVHVDRQWTTNERAIGQYGLAGANAGY